MSYYPTLDEDLARAKAILAEGKLRQEDLPAGASLELAMQMLARNGTIYGKDIYAAYQLLESFVAHIESHFRPDHNGECLNCDETEDAHGLIDQAENYQLLLALMGVTDYKSAVLAWKAQRDLVDAVGENVCKLALRQQKKLAAHDQPSDPDK